MTAGTVLVMASLWTSCADDSSPGPGAPPAPAQTGKQTPTPTAQPAPAAHPAGDQPAAPDAAAGVLTAADPIPVVFRPQGAAFRPADPAWNALPVRPVAVSAQMIAPPRGGGAVTSLAVQAMHDGQWLAIRIRWPDPHADDSVRVDTFRDALAVGFPAQVGDRLPSPFMGDAEQPVNIWQWTADFDANSRGERSFDALYPHTEGVWYFPQDDLVTASVRAWRGFEPVIEFEARGWGSLTRKGSQNVYGTGAHDGTHWTVVFRRQLSTGRPQDVLFRPGQTSHVLFAVWNGSTDEVNGKKSISLVWTEFALADTRTKSGQKR